MKLSTSLLAFLQLDGCRASSLRSVDGDGEERKLEPLHAAMSSPLNDYSFMSGILRPVDQNNNGSKCYNGALSSVDGGPTTAQLLVMFSDRFVEHKGKVYTNLQSYGEVEVDKYGLYEVIDQPGSCVKFQLLYENGNMGKIVATSKFDPIEIIAVDTNSGLIYGYLPDPAGSSLPWKRKATSWGTARDGSLVTEPVEEGQPSEVVCVSTNGEMCHLWGWSSDEFNFALDEIMCAYGPPASIGDWTGVWAGSRGFYCPKQADNQLSKWTWHDNGAVVSDLGWEPAQRIGRLSRKSNIYGVSTNGNLLTLWDEQGVAVHSAPLHFPELTHVRSVGGLDDGYERGIFASNDEDRVFNVFWDGGWKTKEMPSYHGECGFLSVFFGNFDDRTYMLLGNDPKCTCPQGSYQLFRFDFVGGPNRYDATPIQSGSVQYPWRRRLCG